MKDISELSAADQVRVQQLDFLIAVAQETQGAEVWRALFAAMRQAIMFGVFVEAA